MRRCFPTRIGSLWSGWKEEHPFIKRLIAEGSIPEVWRTIVGDRLADVTEVNFVRGVLYVKVGPSVVRHEIFMNRENFRYELNSALGEELVRTIIVK
ncbi:MAG: DUF721 domain-containing protein [Tidjanibacter sp.]|jgi:hypothetical protein|nr:DUF721 domain-containing protein [Tidjanibacter sp.]